MSAENNWTNENDYITERVSDKRLRAAGMTRQELSEWVSASDDCRCACGRKEAWVSAKATTASYDYCPVYGAHVVTCIVVGCETHTHWGGMVANVGRGCPKDCRWSRGEYLDGVWVPEDEE